MTVNIVVIGAMPTGSMRCMRVADALAEEINEPVFIGGGQRESQPANTLISEPDASAPIYQGSHTEFSVGLNKNFIVRIVRGWLDRHRRNNRGPRSGDISNDLFKISRGKLTVQLNQCLLIVMGDGHGDKES